MNLQDQQIVKDTTGKYVYKQEIPMASNINNISQRLFREIQGTAEFKHITVEDIRNLILKEI